MSVYMYKHVVRISCRFTEIIKRRCVMSNEFARCGASQRSNKIFRGAETLALPGFDPRTVAIPTTDGSLFPPSHRQSVLFPSYLIFG